ncbi:CusA/CzcA family heavy metal efflux RND transporter [Pseudoduganella sp. FT93W]|uniref:CusA/CzcA family heavy metal efflux RND transporter n=1 Tax=Duganella fentianensis TaxID=2692177 RepID=A0A845I268_9BURK|nr:CusA/CzcA family heavy metal efflux RND transporter [Duganella fentianensis]MYN47620.1 CusA/CzcA family heavy metal efflux RND transporter [Duganella fentianensis]
MIARIVNVSVRHPWQILFAALFAAVVGAFALVRLPIDAVPDITNTQVQINVVVPALAPADVERQVTYPIETAFAGIPGLESTRSLTRHGFAQVTTVFKDGTDVYFARQQIAERLRSVERALPPGATATMGPIATGLGDVYMWTVEFSNTHTGASGAGMAPDGSYTTPAGELLRTEKDKATYLRTVQDWIVAPQLKNTPGLAGVDVIGGYVKQYVVTPDPQRLAALGIGLSELAEALERNNTSVGAGVLVQNGEALTIQADARLTNSAELAKSVIATRGGMPVLLSQVAQVGVGQEIRFGSASEGGVEVVLGTAVMRIGENSRTVAAAVDARLKEIARSLPPGIVIKPVLNRTRLVDSTINTVAKNLTEGALLVIAVLFALLGNLRAALIAAAVIPVTMLLTSAGMLQMGLSANLMSLGALDFGLIVDGAVIIVENVLRRLAEQQHANGAILTRAQRLEVVGAAAREMIRPSVYGQAIIILVYVPLLTFQGVEGRMFTPMAITVILALLFAFLLSLTVVPAAIALWLSRPINHADNKLVSAIGKLYVPWLDRVMPRPMLTAGLATAAFVGAIALFHTLGQEFLPTLDEHDVLLEIVRIPGTSLDQSQAMQFEVEKAVSKVPEVELAFSRTGTAELASDPMPPNQADTFVTIKDRSQWPDPSLSKSELIEKIERALADIPGQNYELTQPIQMRFNELLAGVRGDIAIKVYGDDFASMLKVADKVADQLRAIEGATGVRVEQVQGMPRLDAQLDRDAMARVGLTAKDVFDTLAVAVAGREAGQIYEGDRRFDVVVRLTDSARNDIEALRQLPVLTPAGKFVPLGAVARLELAKGAGQISRENGKRRVVVQANVRGRDIASVVKDAQAAIDAKVPRPPGVWLTWGGQFENLERARLRLAVVVPACFLLIVGVLYSAVGSWRAAAVVFTGVPLALIGGVLALWLRGLPFSISAAVGFIALSGVAVLNGLVMVGAIDELAKTQPWKDAVRLGALRRLRPVLMTALVASLGFVPMALANGAGAEVQRPLATVVIGGLLSTTLLTLLVLPALYARFGKPVRQGDAVH